MIGAPGLPPAAAAAAAGLAGAAADRAHAEWKDADDAAARGRTAAIMCGRRRLLHPRCRRLCMARERVEWVSSAQCGRWSARGGLSARARTEQQQQQQQRHCERAFGHTHTTSAVLAISPTKHSDAHRHTDSHRPEGGPNNTKLELRVSLRPWARPCLVLPNTTSLVCVYVFQSPGVLFLCCCWLPTVSNGTNGGAVHSAAAASSSPPTTQEEERQVRQTWVTRPGTERHSKREQHATNTEHIDEAQRTEGCTSEQWWRANESTSHCVLQ